MVLGLMSLPMTALTSFRTSSVGNNPHGPLGTFSGYPTMRSGLGLLTNLYNQGSIYFE